MKIQRLAPRLSTLMITGALAASCGDAPSDLQDERPVAFETAPLCVVHSPTLFGIDVSKWQGTIDWAKVKAAGVKYAFIRVSDGITTIDGQFPANWAGAAANGIPRGVYQFFRPNRDALQQAQIVIDHLDLYGMGELPPVIDVEANGDLAPAAVAAQVGIWMDEIESTLGVRPIIYSGSYFWDDNVNSAAWSSYPFWIAHYTSAECPRLPQDWADWTFWQYSSTGAVNGIAGNVDTNRFAGTADELLDLVPDEPCRLDPALRDCQGDVARACVDGRLETTACGASSSCVGAACVADSPEPGPEPVESGPEVVETIEPVPEIVEPSPEIIEPDTTPEDTRVVDTSVPDTTPIDSSEPVDTHAPDGATHALTPSRSISRREVTPSGGCAGGGEVPFAWIAGILVFVLRRPRKLGS